MNTNIFRAYDVRGVYNKDLTEETARLVGKSFGTFVGQGKTVGVGRDVRLSSTSLRNALVKGLLEVGCNVIDFGEVPTPIIYFAVIQKKLDAGMMITASHLPPEWNGFKMCDAEGIVYSDGTGLEHVKEIFEKGNFETADPGRLTEDKNIIDEYRVFIKSKITINKKFKVVADFANSVTSLVIPNMLKELGFQVYELHEKLDGNFPNRASEPNEESLQKLRQKVLELGADIGIGFDGDGDRVGFVDDKGKIVFSGNVVIPIFANYILQNPQNGLSKKVVFDVTCSQAVENTVSSKGGTSVIIRVGHSYCSHTVKNEKAVFGGQYSGHYAFPEVGYVDDAMFAAVKMLEILSNENRKFSEIIESLPKYQTSPMQEIACDDIAKFDVVKHIGHNLSNEAKKLIEVDGVKAYFDNGWVLIRASNTAPMIRVIAEGKTKEDMQQLFEYGKQMVLEEIGKI